MVRSKWLQAHSHAGSLPGQAALPAQRAVGSPSQRVEKGQEEEKARVEMKTTHYAMRVAAPPRRRPLPLDSTRRCANMTGRPALPQAQGSGGTIVWKCRRVMLIMS